MRSRLRMGVEKRPGPPQSCSSAAVVVVHGMGQHDRYVTLDAFTRGIVDAAYRAGASPRSPAHVLRLRGSDERREVVSSVGIDLAEALPHCGARRLEIFELYWAPLTQRKIKLPRVLAWLARTSLTPLRTWATDPEAAPRSRTGALVALLGAIGRALLLVVGVMLIVAPFALVAGFHDRIEDAGDALWQHLSAFSGFWAHVDLILPALLIGSAIALIVTVATTVVRRRPRNRMDVDESATRRWAAAACIVAGLLAVTAAVLELVIGPHRLSEYVDDVAGEVVTWPLIGIAVASVGGWVLRGFLVDSLGDVPLYVTADEKSDLYKVRAEVLDQSASFLAWLLGEYQAIYVAGHSLGSVIAYDTLNALQRDMRIDPPRERRNLEPLQGLFTFGSPLDKVEYFFRTRVGANQKVRAQLLESLHGFKRTASDLSFEPYTFHAYDIPAPQGFWWVNYYASLDGVSGRLSRFEPEEQCRMPYRSARAHSMYWEDDTFYDHVYSRL